MRLVVDVIGEDHSGSLSSYMIRIESVTVTVISRIYLTLSSIL